MMVLSLAAEPMVVALSPAESEPVLVGSSAGPQPLVLAQVDTPSLADGQALAAPATKPAAMFDEPVSILGALPESLPAARPRALPFEARTPALGVPQWSRAMAGQERHVAAAGSTSLTGWALPASRRGAGVGLGLLDGDGDDLLADLLAIPLKTPE
jgi:hypothetical protein